MTSATLRVNIHVGLWIYQSSKSWLSCVVTCWRSCTRPESWESLQEFFSRNFSQYKTSTQTQSISAAFFASVSLVKHRFSRDKNNFFSPFLHEQQRNKPNTFQFVITMSENHPHMFTSWLTRLCSACIISRRNRLASVFVKVIIGGKNLLTESLPREKKIKIVQRNKMQVSTIFAFHIASCAKISIRDLWKLIVARSVTASKWINCVQNWMTISCWNWPSIAIFEIRGTEREMKAIEVSDVGGIELRIVWN